jgi:hypothetical protein
VALRTICFVAHTEEIAARMSQALDDHLGRTDLERRSLPDDAVTRALRDDLLACIVAVSPRASRGLASVLGEVRFAFTAAEAPRTLEVAVLGRRLAEATSDLLLGKCAARVDLLNRIEKLRDKRVAPWIVSYLHMLRVLGNEAAHEKDLPERVPVRPGDGDAKTLLFCMVRILEFLRDHPKAVTDGGALP